MGSLVSYITILISLHDDDDCLIGRNEWLQLQCRLSNITGALLS